jgi:hypothetical protein
MIQIEYEEPQSAEWVAWRQRAKDATDQLIARAAADATLKMAEEVSDVLYKERRADIFGPFHRKCAYCECHIIGVNQDGDVEHFRPKGAVHDAQNKVVKVRDASGKEQSHRGYFWLAYDWRNLLPSCILCNQLRTPNNELFGKGNRFPVRHVYAARPEDDLLGEEPLLLHPVFDDPADHLTLDPGKGVLGGLTDRGQTTIAILGLNREGLITERQRVYQSVVNAFLMLVSAKLQQLLIPGLPDQTALLRGSIDAHEQGSAPFAFVGRRAIGDAQKQLGAA